MRAVAVPPDAPATKRSESTDLRSALKAYRDWWYSCATFPGEADRELIRGAAERDPSNGEALFYRGRDLGHVVPSAPAAKARQLAAAVEYISTAADRGFEPAIAEIAFERLTDPRSEPAQIEEAKRKLLVLVQQRQPDALMLLGEAYAQGFRNAPRNLVEAEKLLRVAVLSGMVRASGDLADVLLQMGKPDQALTALRGGADAGDADAQVKLGRWLENGVPAPVDLHAAETQFRRAAAAGHPVGQAELAVILSKKEGMAHDAEIIQLLTAAAKHLDGPKLKLSHIYLTGGFGCDIDLKRAETLLREAAEDGMPEANYELGCAELTGFWLPRDTAAGARHLAAAARAGSSDAEGFLRLYNHLAQRERMNAATGG